MLVKDVMNTSVQTIESETTVQEAAQSMREHRIGSLVVIHNAKLAGILTERDILDKVVAEAKDSSKIIVKSIMSHEVIMISPEKDITEAAEIMVERKIKKLPVLEGNKIVGIVTVSDLCTAEPRMLEQVGAMMMMDKKKIIAG